MTTIKLKNGSGAPTAGDLAQGEPALDLTNKRLYTEDSGGTVIEVGTNPGEDVTFADNRKAVFGAGSDLQIYHDGNHSYIQDSGTGNLYLAGDTNVGITNSAGTEWKVKGTTDGAVELYYNNEQRLATTTTGIDVTGVITTDGMTTSADINFGDNDKAVFGAGSDLQIYHDGLTSIIKDAGTGELQLHAENNLRLQNLTGSTYALFSNGAAASLYYNGSAKLATTSTGVDVTGTVTADGLTVDGNASAQTYRSSRTDGDVYIQAATDTDFVRIGTQTKPKLFNIDGSGDISFYEDTGTTAKLFWDASAESLGIGTSPTYKFEVSDGTRTGVINPNLALDGIFIGVTQAKPLVLGTNDTEAMRIDASGNVGIGTSSPSYLLHVNGGNQFNTGWIRANTGTAANPNFTIDGGAGMFRPTSNEVAFSTASTERMRIDSSGNLLVGTTDSSIETSSSTEGVNILPDKINVARSAGVTANFNRISTDGNIVQFRKDGSTVGSIGSSAGNSIFLGSGDVGVRFSDTNDAIYPMTTGGINRDAATDLGLSLVRFKDLYLSGNINLSASSQINSSTAFYLDSDIIHFRRNNEAESARIDSSGNLLVGTTSVPTTNVGGAAFSPNDNARTILKLGTTSTSSLNLAEFYNPNGRVGSISTSASATTYSTSSDQRLKDNIVDAPSASDDIDAIQVRSFDWKADGSHQKYGMVAQELQSVAPEAVSEGETEEDMMGVDYSKLVPMLVKEIQSLRARVAQLEGAN